MNRVYYLMELRLVSPMSVGSGETEYTDHDIILDSRGKPMIPATAIAGVFRHYLYDLRDKLFGSIKNDTAEKSHIIFYDAAEIDGTYITARDCVHMNEDEKTARDTGKFDLQAEETGAVFEAVIELDEDGCKYIDRVESAISALNEGLLRFGGKSTRGYGQVKINALYKAEFQLPEDADRWLDFDCFSVGDACYKKAELKPVSDNRYTKIRLNLSQNGGIIIRTYTTERFKLPESDKSKEVNSKHIALKDGTPIIPGTSWAGAFRSRYLEFAGKEKCNELFGYVDDKGNTRVSRIIFSESRIEKSTNKLIKRTAIDRYTNGTKDSALFSERSVFNGECSLEIIVKDLTDEERTVLSAVICDLDRGYLAVGGETSIGRGLFKVDSITVNGSETTEYLRNGEVSAMLKEG